jgi:hypothetical protein
LLIVMRGTPRTARDGFFFDHSATARRSALSPRDDDRNQHPAHEMRFHTAI